MPLLKAGEGLQKVPGPHRHKLYRAGKKELLKKGQKKVPRKKGAGLVLREGKSSKVFRQE